MGAAGFLKKSVITFECMNIARNPKNFIRGDLKSSVQCFLFSFVFFECSAMCIVSPYVYYRSLPPVCSVKTASTGRKPNCSK